MANHVSFVDGAVMMGAVSRLMRFIVYADFTRVPLLKPFSEMMRVIPIKVSEGPRSLVNSLKTAKEALQAGDIVGIFAEGQITRTGQLQPFQRGLMKIVEGTNCPVIRPTSMGCGAAFSASGEENSLGICQNVGPTRSRFISVLRWRTRMMFMESGRPFSNWERRLWRWTRIAN